jgi:hypothetical protein
MDGSSGIDVTASDTSALPELLQYGTAVEDGIAQCAQ